MLWSHCFAVKKRVEIMEAEIESIQESICHMYKMDLMRYPTATKNMLWKDYLKKVSAVAIFGYLAHLLAATSETFASEKRTVFMLTVYFLNLFFIYYYYF